MQQRAADEEQVAREAEADGIDELQSTIGHGSGSHVAIPLRNVLLVFLVDVLVLIIIVAVFVQQRLAKPGGAAHIAVCFLLVFL